MTDLVTKNEIIPQERELRRLLPPEIFEELMRLCRGRVGNASRLTELHLRAEAISSAVFGGKNLPLFQRIGKYELNRVLDKMLDHSPYAYERELSFGYITLECGIRVGVVYSACYGRRELSSLSLRMPTLECSYADALFQLWQERGRDGTLLFSLPGGGKTTALTALCKKISVHELLRIVIADERGEIPSDKFKDTTTTLIRGIPKSEAILTALCTLSPEIIATDEITDTKQIDALISAGRGGVPLIATVHASSAEELLLRPSLKELLLLGYFPLTVRLYTSDGEFFFEEETI